MSKRNKEKEQDTNLKVISRIEDAISDLKNKNFTMFFFVVDSKNVPNGSMCYIYQMAKAMQDKGYDVCMLYQLENEYTQEEIELLEKNEQPLDDMRRFVGVTGWLGEEYGTLRHMNIMKEKWEVSPSDFLFIPEVFQSIMFHTYKNKITCKRYVILQNYDYVTEFIPLGQQWANYGIDHVIATNENQAKLINDVFPYTEPHTTVINPFIPDYFRKPLKAKNLIVNIIAKNKDDVNRIVKPFYWKYPVYQFVSFRDLRGFPRKKYAEMLKEGCITIWVDEHTPFGYGAVEAMRCGNIVIGKIPDQIPEWMSDYNGIWFNDINNVPDLVYRAVSQMLADEIPHILADGMTETDKKYTYEEYDRNITNFLDKMIEERIGDMTTILDITKKNNMKEENNEQ